MTESNEAGSGFEAHTVPEYSIYSRTREGANIITRVLIEGELMEFEAPAVYRAQCAELADKEMPEL
jgi:hypothetical protein